jgi:hypothetical protein
VWTGGVKHIDEEAGICGTREAYMREVVWKDIEIWAATIYSFAQEMPRE